MTTRQEIENAIIARASRQLDPAHPYDAAQNYAAESSGFGECPRCATQTSGSCYECQTIQAALNDAMDLNHR